MILGLQRQREEREDYFAWIPPFQSGLRPESRSSAIDREPNWAAWKAQPAESFYPCDDRRIRRKKRVSVKKNLPDIQYISMPNQ
jgi:hypothetical protein